MLSQLRQRLPTSPLSLCMLIRYSARLLQEDDGSDSDTSREIYDMMVKCLRHSSDVPPPPRRDA